MKPDTSHMLHAYRALPRVAVTAALLLAAVGSDATLAAEPFVLGGPISEADALKLSEEYKRRVAEYDLDEDPDGIQRQWIGTMTRQLLTWAETHGNDGKALELYLGEPHVTWTGWEDRNPREYWYLSYEVNRIYLVRLDKKRSPRQKTSSKIADVWETRCFDLEVGR